MMGYGCAQSAAARADDGFAGIHPSWEILLIRTELRGGPLEKSVGDRSRMIEPQYTIHIRQGDSAEVEEVVCERTLRVLPGRREVFDASWDGRNVITKVFYHRLKARRHCRREAEGLRRLAERGIDVPSLLFSGRTVDGHWAVVTEKIEDAVNLTEAREGFGDAARRDDILRLAARLLAKMHQQGVAQLDFHPGNFLVQGDRLIVIDPAQIRFGARPISRRFAMKQLARLTRILLPGKSPDSVEILCVEYARLRGWQFDDAARATFRRAFRVGQAKGIRRHLNRLQVKDKQHVRIRRQGFWAVVRKPLYEAGDFVSLMDRIDEVTEAGRILLDGDPLVCEVVWGGRDIVVERFEEGRSVLLRMSWLRCSRARRRWLVGYLLPLVGIASARPLAFIERRMESCVQRSYLLREKVEGQTLHELLWAAEVPADEKKHTIRQLVEALDRLACYGVTYGDPELTGIRVRQDDLVFVGLGDLTWHWFPGSCRWRYAKELRRLSEALRSAGLDMRESDLRGLCGR